MFAPANMRAAAGNDEYQRLIQYWMAKSYTLRYSGGMVPDIHHILTKVIHSQYHSFASVTPLLLRHCLDYTGSELELLNQVRIEFGWCCV